MRTCLTGDDVNLTRVVELEGSSGAVVGLEMPPQDVPSSPRIGIGSWERGDTASCCKAIIDALTALGIECIANVKILVYIYILVTLIML